MISSAFCVSNSSLYGIEFVCMYKTCPMVLVAPFEDRSFSFSLHWIMVSIEHTFLFVNTFIEHMFEIWLERGLCE